MSYFYTFNTVKDLKDALEDFDDNLRLRVALQQNYPLGGVLENLCEQDNRTLWLAVSDGYDYAAKREMWEDTDIYTPADEEDEDDE